MVLYLIGLGLGDEKDITVKGLEAVRKCTRVYLEMYTAILTGIPKETLVLLSQLIVWRSRSCLQEKFYGCKITEADREMVESGAEAILRDADKEDVAVLVVGDPFAYVHVTIHASKCSRASVC